MKSSHHSNDTIRSLKNQIECLKEELSDGEMLRQQLIQENNELQKQITHENVVIPQLENELKSLTQENDYLKLLGKSFEEYSCKKKVVTYSCKILDTRSIKSTKCDLFDQTF